MTSAYQQAITHTLNVTIYHQEDQQEEPHPRKDVDV
jgi:hypothetical protein